MASGKELRRYGDAKTEVTGLALAPDGKTLTYSTHPDGMVHIWDLAADRNLVPPWKANAWNINSIAYSPDSKKVALGRNTIAIHEVATGKRLNPPTESESAAQQIEYAGDGKALALWRQDKTIELWDTAKWRKVATLAAKVGRFTSMVFSPDGKRLTTAEGDYSKRGRLPLGPKNRQAAGGVPARDGPNLLALLLGGRRHPGGGPGEPATGPRPLGRGDRQGAAGSQTWTKAQRTYGCHPTGPWWPV